MVESVFMAELSWPEWKAKIEAGGIIFIPLGATEQHGPHLPLNVDVILPTAVCEAVARNVGGLVAPTLSYGYKSMPRSGGGQNFPATTSLDANTLSLMIRDIIRDMGAHGARRFVLINGHFENAWPAVEGLDLALRELRRDGITDVIAMRLEYWDFVKQETLERIFPNGFPGTELEHASLIETSLMLLLRPDLVDESKIPQEGRASFPPYDIIPAPPGYLRQSGVLADARGSRAEIGKWLMDDHVSMITEAVRKEFGL
ncbi:creatininase [Acidocella aromatica]|uniref:Creatinine amidohydrolase n=1 Tax=Acidocella aromatica TaxID=1303579 RepID=A0A840VF87_9PROT|nr:creatininase [Acidocella aromatica]MBB5374464.1 creatinine amidohydrolase [Acidocella aromatica]